MRRRAFTLTELLVVTTIIVLVSAVALPTVLPALQSRQVGEAARIVQAALAGARDAAIRANAPRGIRLLPDATLSGSVRAGAGTLQAGQTLTSSRIVPIEPAPDLTDSSIRGSATFVDRVNSTWAGGTPPPFPVQLNPPRTPPDPYPAPLPAVTPCAVLVVAQSLFQDNLVPPAPALPLVNPPTNWFWNVRLGDRIRFNDSGRYYTVVGPVTQPNPEGFVNDGLSGAASSLTVFYGTPGNPAGPFRPEYLFLVNGADDDLDGFPDNGFDGVNLNPSAAGPVPAGPTDDAGEWTEVESWFGAQARGDAAAQNNLQPPVLRWTIARRPVPSPGAREVALPAGAAVDLTTWDSTRERSRLPVDPFSGAVDILLDPAGRVVPATAFSSPASAGMADSFLHVWVASRDDVAVPVTSPVPGANPPTNAFIYPALPVPLDAAGSLPAGHTPVGLLRRELILVTLFARSGAVVTTSPEGAFDYADGNAPYRAARLGVRDSK